MESRMQVSAFKIAAAISVLAASAILAQQAERAAILIGLKPDKTFAEKVAGDGYIWATPDKPFKAWTGEYLGQFNAVVLTSYPQVGTQGPAEWQQRFIALLQRYVQEGGGLLLCGGNNQDTGMCVRFQNELLKPYGAVVLREFVNDKQTKTKGRCFAYGWTDRVAREDLTGGVQGLFYPMVTGWGGTSVTNPIRVDENWKVLVRAAPSAYTCALYDSKPMEDRPATYSTSPPLLAVREVGGGRIVLWPTLATASIVDGYHYMWDDGLIMEGRVGRRSSQGLKLTANLLTWLVEPSLKSGRPGGYRPKEEKRQLEKEPGFQEYQWDEAKVPDGLPNAYKVLIGARTALSSGSGTVVEYAREARKYGYSLLAVTEDMEKMNPQKWNTLVRQCRAATSEGFVVLPGLKFFDENGNQGVVYGDIGWPKDEWMSEKEPGRIKAIWHFTHGYHYWPPLAIITSKSNPKRPWFLGKCKGFAAFTYRNGKLIDESVDEYLEMMRLRFDDFVLAVHLLDSPSQVKAAAAPENMQTYVRSGTVGGIHGHMSGTWGQPNLWYWPVFVSNGPMIKTFQAINPGTTDLAVPGAERYRLRLEASSSAPLSEVRLMDGSRLMRRLQVNGKDFDRHFDFFHDRQRTWVAIVSDQEGRNAISWGRWTEVQEQWFTNCSDNWNYMDGGKWSGSRFHALRGMETRIPGASHWWFYPRLNPAKKGSIPPGYPAIFVDKVMASRFASVVDYNVIGVYEPGASANFNDFCKREGILSNDAYEARTRCTFFTSRPDEPQVRLIEGKILTKKPLELPGNRAVLVAEISSGEKAPEDYNLLAIYDASGQVLVERRPQTVQGEIVHAGILARGGYIGTYPGAGGLAGIFALEAGMPYYAWFSSNNTTTIYVHASPPGKVAAGAKITYRLLAVKGRKFSKPSNEELEWVRTSLGLNGEPRYELKSLVGQVLSTFYVLRVKAEEGGFRARFNRAHLPMDIPVIVEGLNDRWCAGVWYVGKNPMWRPEWTLDYYGQLVPVMKEKKIKDAWYPGPVQDGLGYFGIDVERSDREVFAGNFLVCDNPQVFLQILDLRPGKRTIEAHNAEKGGITCTITPAKGFDLLGTFRKRVTIPAGSSVLIRLD